MPEFADWYNQNEMTSYPVALSADQLGVDGYLLPEDVICDLNLSFPETAGKYAMVSSVTVTDHIVSATFGVIDYQPGETIPPGSSFVPLAAVTLTQPVDLYRNYPVESLYEGAGGWIAFGKGTETRRINWRSSTLTSGFINLKAARGYPFPPFSGISPSDNANLLLTDVVGLLGDQGLEIVKDIRRIDGVAKECIVIQTSEDMALEETRDLIGDCAKLAEQGECDPPLLRLINGVGADELGDVTITDVGSGDGYLEPIPGGLAILSYIDLSDHCKSTRNMPDKCGNLPNARYDPCTEGRWNWCSSEVPHCTDREDDSGVDESGGLDLPAIPSNVTLFTSPALRYFNGRLVSYYKFEDENNYTRTPIPDILGRNALSDSAFWFRVSGKDGYGFKFDTSGTYNFLEAYPTVGLDFDGKGWTFSTWVKLPVGFGTATFFDKTNSILVYFYEQDGKTYVNYTAYVKPYGYALPISVSLDLTSAGITSTNWNLYVFRCFPTQSSIRLKLVLDVNGVCSRYSEYASGSGTATGISVQMAPFRIGAGVSGYEPANVEMDELGIWYRPINDNAVIELYNDGVGRFVELT